MLKFLPKVQKSLRGATSTAKKRLNRKGPLQKPLWLWLASGTVVGGGAIAALIGWIALESSLPGAPEDILTFAREETLTIEAADGSIIQEIGPVTHEKLKITQIPKQLQQAFLAIEDNRFTEHRGVDLQGILRATVSNIFSRKVVEGGSTITQQLARIVFLNQERSILRKLKEMRLAQKIEAEFDKNQILESYLNYVYLGSGAYGVGDAAWVYFTKPVDKLTLPEMATIAGVAPAPSLYSPLENKDAARKRRNLVLQKMQEQGFITAAQAKEAIDSPLETKETQPKRLEQKFPYFVAYIQQEIPKYVSKEVLKQGGLTVESTLNPAWQEAAESSVNRLLGSYGKWQRFKQAALVTIDPRNGEIKAMVGGSETLDNQFNRVTQAKRQPGSTFKTFVYTAGIAAGFSPYRSYMDAKYTVDGYKPENYGDKYRNGYLSIKDALSYSVNVIAVQSLIDVGWKPVIDVARKMGIKSELKPTFSLALGASEVNLLELTSAYGTLANKGLHKEPRGIRRIVDRKGKVLYEAKFADEKALDEETTALVTWMLRGVVNYGTGGAANIGRPVAGKTGTSDDYRDLWFVGYIPQLVTGIWLGNDDNSRTWGASSTAAYLWGKFMRKVVDDMPVESFPSIPGKFVVSKPAVKREKIKPKHAYFEFPKKEEEETKSTSERSSNSKRRRRRSTSTESR